jgi:hypothetical protein
MADEKFTPKYVDIADGQLESADVDSGMSKVIPSLSFMTAK